MSLALWNEPLTDAERDLLLNKVTQAVARRRLQTPALLALEINRPLSYLASQSMIALAPMIAPLIGLEQTQHFSRLLAEPGVVDELILRIEATQNNSKEKP